MQIKKDERSEIKSTSHARYRCQYHIVFAPKYRRKEIYGQLKKDIGEILRTLCKQKSVEILETETTIHKAWLKKQWCECSRKSTEKPILVIRHWIVYCPLPSA